MRSSTFGVPRLRSAADCERLAEDASRRCDELVERVLEGVRSPSPRALVALDEISASVCSVLDTMELARNVHPDPVFVRAADAAYDRLACRMAELNTDTRLYESVRAVLSDAASNAMLTDELSRFGACMRSEFEHDGAHLSAGERSKLRELRAEADTLASEYAAGAAARDPDGGVWLSASSLRGLPEHLLNRLPSHPSSGTEVEVKVLADRSLLNLALQTVECSEARRALHEALEALAPRNLDVLHRLLRTRHSVAQCLGHPSYASLSLSHDRMETSVEAVVGALSRLCEEVAPRAEEELGMLRRAKGAALEPWDLPYLMNLERSRHAGVSEAEVSQYLELEDCIRGVSLTLDAAFGLSLERVQPAEGELWHPSVRKMLLSSADEPLGVLYLDLAPRPAKQPQPALYTLRGGVARSEAEAATGDGLSRHLPCAALVCDLPTPDGPGCDTLTGKALLRHAQLETLCHEFGHALHALVARTETQHFAGTRAYLDFVEVPSGLLEHFAWEPRALRLWARHHRTREPMPQELAEKLCSGRSLFSGIELQTQALHAIADLELHGEAAADLDADASTRLVAALAAKHTCLPTRPDAPPRWHASFRHLASYGAGYYTYLWARSISRRIWFEGFERDPLGGRAGQRWCETVLRHGGAREPRSLLRAMLETGGGGGCERATEDDATRSSAALRAELALSRLVKV